MYQKQADGTVRLVWNTLLYPPNRENVWLLNLDALTGSVLLRQDLVVHEQMNRRQTSAASSPSQPQGSLATQRLTGLVAVTPTLITTATVTATPTITPTTIPLPAEASYRVLPMPLENPEDGPGLPSAQSMVFDPADPVASPFGWHDVDGMVGAEFYETRGNNVTAQEDLNADNMGGQRAAPSTPGKLVFDYAFNPAQEPDAGHNQTQPARE